MLRRSGFTLLEVVIASVVLAISLTGIGAMGFQALSKTNKPNSGDTAALLAAERLSYFRAQRNPYFAVGGTYYAPPPNRMLSDRNSPPDGPVLNNVVNGGPQLFIREYLASVTEGRYDNTRYGGAGVQSGQDSAKLRFNATAVNSAATLASLGLNEIPPSVMEWDVDPANGTDPESLSGYLPNTRSANFNLAVAKRTLAGYPDMYFVTAPRANANLVHGSTLPANIKWVREVWIQTNQPNFSTNAWAGAFTPLADIARAGANVVAPAAVMGLPPYVVAVTVRVFERDVQTGVLNLTSEPPDGLRNTSAPPYSGPGYNRRRPLANAVGYFGLWRTLRY